MELDWVLVLGSILVSLVVAPATVYYSLVASGGLPVRVVGLLALVPGFLMGGTALWVAARG